MIVIALVMLGAPAQVSDCHDGGACTMVINLGLNVWKVEDVQLCDIDAPKMHTGDPGVQARKMILMLLRSAKTIAVIPSGGIYRPRRSFSRLLGWVIADGKDVGQLLVEGGLAEPATTKCDK